MGLFGSSYDDPGPDGKDEARKTGLARLLELITRDLGTFIWSGMLAALAFVPFLAGVLLSLFRFNFFFLLIACVAGGGIFGIVFCGLVDTILRRLRDEAGFRWYVWRRSIRRNWKACLPLGALFGVLLGGLLSSVLLMMIDSAPTSAHLILMGIAAFFTLVLFVWTWPQIALMELPISAVFKNAFLLALSHPLRTLAATAGWGAYIVLIALFFPYSIPVFPFTLWIPAVLALHMIYTSLNDTFHIEETKNGG